MSEQSGTVRFEIYLQKKKKATNICNVLCLFWCGKRDLPDAYSRVGTPSSAKNSSPNCFSSENGSQVRRFLPPFQVPIKKKKGNEHLQCSLPFLVRETGLEPVRC